MTEHKSNESRDDEDTIIKNQMEQMVNSYDKYMKRITFGREDALRTMTVNLAQVKSGDCVLEVGCATGTLSLAAKRQAGQTGSVFGLPLLSFVRGIR
jgi:ubiquinone/menaquinone biosynthesis C-methylase UbiE